MTGVLIAMLPRTWRCSESFALLLIVVISSGVGGFVGSLSLEGVLKLMGTLAVAACAGCIIEKWRAGRELKNSRRPAPPRKQRKLEAPDMLLAHSAEPEPIGLAELSLSSSVHQLEEKYLAMADVKRPLTLAVQERRRLFSNSAADEDEGDEREEFYKAVYGRCCESVIGEIWIPVGVVGPIPLNDGRLIKVPMATVEGALVASVNRGCKLIRLAWEADPTNLEVVFLGRPGMTRGPCLEAPTANRAQSLLRALEDAGRFPRWKEVFDASSPGGHVSLTEIRGRLMGRYVYVRVRADTSQAMGMNMLTRGTDLLMQSLLKEFSDCRLVAVSGNYCTDKKSSALNWIEGRGWGVGVTLRLSAALIARHLKGVAARDLIKVNIMKNLVGSALAGSLGGFNAQVANVLGAVYLATGQDVAQIVDGAQALTFLEAYEDEDGCEGEVKRDRLRDCSRSGIIMTLTLPALEMGIIGGGTALPRQRAMLQSMGINDVRDLVQLTAVAALAGELSLLAALARDGELLHSHERLNRGKR